MRDVIFTAIMAVLVPVSFAQPWIGVLVWSWLGYMNPHLHCWGFAKYLVPWAQVVAIAILAGFPLTKDRKPFVWCPETFLMLALWVWFTVTTVNAWYQTEAWLQWQTVSKILLMTFMTIPLIQDRSRLRWLLLVIAGSIGFYGFKAGVFVIATGGTYMVFGAPGRTFVSSNNTIALVLNMCLPLFWYLRRDEPRPWLRGLLLATFWLSVLAVPFTYSRGGMLGLCFVLSILSFRSKRWPLVLAGAVLAVLILFAYAPEKWAARMGTITDYEKDDSAMGRLEAWKVGYKLANDHPFLGGGFEVFDSPKTYARYAPELGFRRTDAHSIYFNLLGEHGYVGLGLFLALMLCVFARLVSLYRLGRRYAELSWVADYSYMLGAGILAYLFTGAFLSVAYFDLAWHLFALVVILKALAARELATLMATRVDARPAVRSGAGNTLPLFSPAAYRRYVTNLPSVRLS